MAKAVAAAQKRVNKKFKTKRAAAEKRLRSATKRDVQRLQRQCADTISAKRASSAAGYTAGAEAAAEAEAETAAVNPVDPTQAAAAAEEAFFDAPRRTRNATAMGERPPGFEDPPLVRVAFDYDTAAMTG